VLGAARGGVLNFSAGESFQVIRDRQQYSGDLHAHTSLYSYRERETSIKYINPQPARTASVTQNTPKFLQEAAGFMCRSVCCKLRIMGALLHARRPLQKSQPRSAFEKCASVRSSESEGD
jgi:hypothetical protein